jgi:hypothetical protein
LGSSRQAGGGVAGGHLSAQANTPLWEVEVAVVSLCILLELYPAEVCEGMVHNYGYQVPPYR